MDMNDLADGAKSSSHFYWWLSMCVLHAPTPAELEAILGMDARGTLATPELAAAMEGLISADVEVPSTQREQRLGVEYTRLFGGLLEGSAPPPPYESLWRENRLMGESTTSAIAFYLRAGFSDIDPGAGPQDHLGVELGFMALLALKECEAWQAGDAAEAHIRIDQQRDFLAQHLMAWVPAWAARVRHESREPFYAHLADTINLFLTRENLELNGLAALAA